MSECRDLKLHCEYLRKEIAKKDSKIDSYVKEIQSLRSNCLNLQVIIIIEIVFCFVKT
jgi:hypothetical protein